MARPDFDESTIRILATSHAYARGEEYFESGSVSNLVLKDDGYRANVYGRHRYTVRIWENRSKIQTSCTCRYASEGICRHIVAVMLTILRKQADREDRTDFTWLELGIQVPPPAEEVPPSSKAPEVSGREDAQAADRAKKNADHPAELPPALLANQIMTSPVVTLSPEASLYEAWTLISERRFRHVPVVSQENKLIGIISDRDLLLRVAGIASSDAAARTRPGTTLRDIMQTRVLTASPNTKIRQIAQVLFENRIGAMPVVDENKTLVGMITRSDILRALIHQNRSGS